ncbi:MAG: pyridoxamine 5'-phosphate oxidase [Bacteroidales bacterium]
MIQDELAKIRKDYKKFQLIESNIDSNPYKQFGKWMEEAITAQVEDPTAMCLATISTKGFPTARIVLLKGFDEKGFSFFTNYESRKGNHIKNNPNVAIVFFWKELERQVRIEGEVVKVSKKESDEYFAIRPFESQVSACISEQSATIPDRNYLEMLHQLFIKKQGEKPIQRPENWGGYRVIPRRIEFWQGRENRLHDRIKYCSKDAKNWKIKRIAP